MILVTYPFFFGNPDVRMIFKRKVSYTGVDNPTQKTLVDAHVEQNNLEFFWVSLGPEG